MRTIESQSLQKKSDRLSISISVLMHLLIGILLICFGVFSTTPQSAAETDRPGGIVLTEVNSDQEVEYIDQTDVQQPQISDAFDALDADSQTPAAAVASSAPPELPTLDIPTLPGPPIDAVTNLNANSMAEVPVTSKKAKRFELSKADLEQIAKDRAYFKSLQPKGKATEIALFNGGKILGRKFAFVIDRSHSMGTDGLGVLDEARKQLIENISGLELNHEFQIIAYHDKTTMISARKLLVANDQNKQRVTDFFEGLGAFGATNHFYGLIAGLDLRPDVLILMNDGGSPGLSPNQHKTVKKMAGKHTEIHCIQFGSGPLQQTDNFMRKLARENRGSFRYINVNQWR